MVSPDQLDPPVHGDLKASVVKPEARDQWVPRDRQAQPEQMDSEVNLAYRDQQDRRDYLDQPVPVVDLVQEAMLVHLEAQDSLENQDHKVLPDRRDHLLKQGHLELQVRRVYCDKQLSRTVFLNKRVNESAHDQSF